MFLVLISIIVNKNLQNFNLELMKLNIPQHSVHTTEQVIIK